MGSRVALPLSLLSLAIVAAAIAGYGVHPDLAQFSRGLNAIMLARQLMWPLIAISLLACCGLFGLVIAGKRRAWWLIGLAPVLALFVHRFGPGAPGPADVVDGPGFLDANDRGVPESGDWVVGLIFGDRAYAFPYRALFTHPVVAYTDYDHRMLLMWSAYANRATAFALTRDLRARDLEVVSTPANSLLIYDRRLGQFIVGVTGKLVDGGDVVGFSKSIETQKLRWDEWKSRHPETKVMAADSSAKFCPGVPIVPQFKLRVPAEPNVMTLVTMLSTDPPAAVREDDSVNQPKNVTIGQTPLLIVRDSSGHVRAFDRHLKEDLFLTFAPGHDRKHRDAALGDLETRSSWTIDGRCIDGELKGSHLREIESDDRLYWGVMKHWYPALQLVEGESSR